MSYNGYYVTLPRWRWRFDSAHSLTTNTAPAVFFIEVCLMKNLPRIFSVVVAWYFWLPIIVLSSALLIVSVHHRVAFIDRAMVQLDRALFDVHLNLLAHRQRIARAAGDSDRVLQLAPPRPIDRQRLRLQGCVTDGLLSGYGNEQRNIALINRLPCYYLHRAVETWLAPPDWEMVALLMAQIERPVVYGMFIAEAIDTRAEYLDVARGEHFRFKKMCKPGTRNRWGEHTCVPDFDRKEYRRYVAQIMKEGIDHGVQVFLIGQVQIQDARRREDADIEGVLEDVRSYAAARGVDIMIGAQTNDSTDKDYLRLFDFIEGGVGLLENGRIEDGPCFTRYEAQGWCWALLWHARYREKAPLVLLHLDWSGMQEDDMATFVRMSRAQRAETLAYLYDRFRANEKTAFLLPVFAALPREHPGCYGNKRRYYSADRNYGCADEDAIRQILTN